MKVDTTSNLANKQSQHMAWLWPVVVFVVSLAVLWWNAAPGVSFHDSGEFAMAAASAGIPHPPGAPTWTILASAFIRLGGFHDPARGTNLFSGLMGAVTLALLCLLVQMWTSRIFPELPKWVHPTAGIAAVLVMLHSSGFLEQSFITEQYTLMTALFVTALIIATKIISESNSRTRATKLTGSLGLVVGLAIGNHPSQLLLIVLAAWAILVGRKTGGFARMAGAFAAGLFAGLLVFIWLPLRSHANPVMDWGNVKTLDRFIWAITRKQWTLRPISEAPRNLVPEWIASYDLIGELSIVGLLLAVIGLAVLVRHQRLLLGWLTGLSLIYGAGMLYGHMRQDIIRLDYIYMYGVVDWHLPVYLACAVSAAIGLAWITKRLGMLPIILVLPILIWGAISSVSYNSLRHYTAPDRYINDMLAPLPPDALIVAAGDNLAFMMGYRTYIQQPKNAPWVIVLSHNMHEVVLRVPNPDDAKRVFVAQMVLDQDRQPFRVALPPDLRDRPIRVFGDYFAEKEGDCEYLIPTGLLYEFVGKKVTNEEVLAADEKFRKLYPDLFREPDAGVRRLDREAYARIYSARGLYFFSRKMWKQSAESYTLSLKWTKENGAIWASLGDALYRMNKSQEAAEAYTNAILYLPNYPEPKCSLAIMHARAGRFQVAEQLLIEALRDAPNNKQAIKELKLVREMIKSDKQ